jgi:hypothetical protein
LVSEEKSRMSPFWFLKKKAECPLFGFVPFLVFAVMPLLKKKAECPLFGFLL